MLYTLFNSLNKSLQLYFFLPLSKDNISQEFSLHNKGQTPSKNEIHRFNVNLWNAGTREKLRVQKNHVARYVI